MSHSDTPVYKRVLLKLSGEALSAGADGILNHEYLDEIVGVIKRCMDKGVQFGIVVGAGNIWRGRQGGTMEHTRADHMGMLATVINSLAIQDAFERADIDARVMTAVPIEAFAEFYSRNKAVSHLNRGKVTISDAEWEIRSSPPIPPLFCAVRRSVRTWYLWRRI